MTGPIITTPLLTPAEVAAMLRVDTRTVARWARENRIPSIRTPGGHRRYPAGAITALIRDTPPPGT